MVDNQTVALILVSIIAVSLFAGLVWTVNDNLGLSQALEDSKKQQPQTQDSPTTTPTTNATNIYQTLTIRQKGETQTITLLEQKAGCIYSGKILVELRTHGEYSVETKVINSYFNNSLTSNSLSRQQWVFDSEFLCQGLVIECTANRNNTSPIYVEGLLQYQNITSANS
jgi:hypothetical protein